MIVKVHKTPDGRKLVALCDKDLIGKRFEEKKLQLDLTSRFYLGKEMSEKEVIEVIKGAYLLNIVGEKSIGFALKLGMLDKKHIIKIKNVPHAQAILE